jgi:NlpC/P60 family
MSPRLCCALLSLVCSSVALAQGGGPAPRTASLSATVTPRQGEAIIAAVWTRERRGGPSPDCSHLVHEVYAIAGLGYPYTDSFDLYAGIGNFVRVTRPQPGDLIVWRGHVGIVINPTEHSFYSSLRSGLGNDFYDAPYWKARGPARFYRFVRPVRTRVTLAQQPPQTATEPVKAISSREEDSRESPSTFPEATEPKSRRATAAKEGYDSSLIDASFEIPSSILVATAQHLPTNEDIAEAVSERNNADASILRDHDFAELARRIIIYDKLTVQRVDARGQRGSAKIRIDSRVALTGQRIERKLGHEEVRWRLVRTTRGWEVLAQPDCIYVPRDVAVHQLATRLALLTQDPRATETNSNLSEQAQIVRALSTLVEGI